MHRAAAEVRSRMKGHCLMGLVNNAGELLLSASYSLACHFTCQQLLQSCLKALSHAIRQLQRQGQEQRILMQGALRGWCCDGAGIHVGLDAVADLPLAKLRKQLDVNLIAQVSVTQVGAVF